MEWIVKECVETAGCKLEVSAAFVGEDVLICLKGGEGFERAGKESGLHRGIS